MYCCERHLPAWAYTSIPRSSRFYFKFQSLIRLDIESHSWHRILCAAKLPEQLHKERYSFLKSQFTASFVKIINLNWTSERGSKPKLLYYRYKTNHFWFHTNNFSHSWVTKLVLMKFVYLTGPLPLNVWPVPCDEWASRILTIERLT